MENVKNTQKNVKRGKANQTKKNNKKGLLMAIILIIIIIVIALIIIQKSKETVPGNSKEEKNSTNTESYVEEIEDGVKINKSTKLNEAKEINGLLITNIQLTTIDGMTTLLADVTNNSGTETEVKQVQITLLDQEGKELVTVTGIVNALDVGETTELNISMTSDFVNAYDFRVSM